MRPALTGRVAGTCIWCSSHISSNTAPRHCTHCRHSSSSLTALSAVGCAMTSGNTATRTAAAVVQPGGPSNRGRLRLDGADGSHGDHSAAAVLPSAMAAAGEDPAAFPFWVDEVLWTQGKPAVELIEQVLQNLGGRRSGGPPRAATASAIHSDLNPDAELDADLDAEAGPSGAAINGSSNSGGQGNNAWQRCQAAAATASSRSGVATADGSGRGGSGRPWSESDLGYSHMEDWVFLWTKSVYAIKAARSLRPGQLVSAVVGLNSLTMKKRMVLTLKQALGEGAWNVMPLSFALPEELPQWEQWLQRNGGADSGLWILKTGQDAGKGLRLLPTSRALQYALRLASSATKPRHQLKVAQTYITRPLLIHNRKFHLRLWLLVTGHSPLRAYLHRSGLVLFSSEVYEADKPLETGVKPAAGHVTNYARNEDTLVWDMAALAAELGQEAFEKLWADMAAATAATAAAALRPMLAAHEWLQPAVQHYGFQVLGLDFLIDEGMRPWLLELNSAPSILAIHSDDDTRAMIASQKSEMLSDTLAMVAHRILPQAAEETARQQQGQQRQRQQHHLRWCGMGGHGQPAGLPWRQQLQLELANKGGYQPLMPLFAALQQQGRQQQQQQQQQQQWQGGQQERGRAAGIPWQPTDFELQQIMQPQ